MKLFETLNKEEQQSIRELLADIDTQMKWLASADKDTHEIAKAASMSIKTINVNLLLIMRILMTDEVRQLHYIWGQVHDAREKADSLGGDERYDEIYTVLRRMEDGVEELVKFMEVKK